MPNGSRDLTRVSLHIGQRRGLCDAECAHRREDPPVCLCGALGALGAGGR